jgi:hypothetical protein
MWCNHEDGHRYLMHPIYNDIDENWALNGWWCPECNKWIRATGRERLFKPSDWHELKQRLRDETPD